MEAFLLSLLAKIIPIVLGGAFGYGVLRSLFGKDAVKNGVQSVFNSVTGADLTGAQVSQNEYASQEAEIARTFNAEEAQKQRDWQMEMDNTKYQRTIADMQAAGVNPMLMMGGTLSSGSSGAAATASPASPSALGRAASMSDLMALLQLPAQMKLLRAEAKKTDADARKADADASAASVRAAKDAADTKRIETETKYFIDTAELRKRSLALANDLTSAKERQVYKSMDQIEANIGKLIAETRSEEARSELIMSQKFLADANARQIVEMLPYHQALAEAQTAQAKAQATLAAVNAAYQNKILNSGYLDSMFSEMSARASSAEAQAQMLQIKAAIRNGTFGDTSTGFKALDWINDKASDVLAGFVNFMDNLNPIAGLLGAVR